MCAQENETKRFAFYQAGKCLVQTLLLHHPKISILKITEASNDTESLNDVLSFSPDLSLIESLSFLKNKSGHAKTEQPRAKSPAACRNEVCERPAPFLQGRDVLQTAGSKLNSNLLTTITLETLLIGFYAGKAGEFFNHYTSKTNGGYVQKQNEVMRAKAMLLHKFVFVRPGYYPVLAPLNCFVFTNRFHSTRINHLLCQSDTGSLERVKATSLAKYLLINGSIYSPHFFNLQKNCNTGNLNKIEISDGKVFDFFTNSQKRITNVFFQDKSLSDLNVYYKKFVSKEINLLSQKKQISAWCEEKVCKALMFSTKSYGHWFRIYLPQIETHQRQPISRDQFFKVRSELEAFVYDLGTISYTQMPALLTRGTRKHNRADASRACKNFGPVFAKRGAFAKTALLHNEAFASNPASFVQAAKPLHSYIPLRLVQELEKTSIGKHSFGRERYLETQFLPQEFGYGMCHNLIVNTFSRALNVISKNRELLDIITDHLIRFEKIRVPDILRICLLYIDDNSFI